MMLAFHRFADLFPLIDGDGFEQLVEDIREHGVRDRIVLFESQILDGRNRWRALQRLTETGEVLGEGWGHRKGECLTVEALEPPHLWFAAFNPHLDGDPLAWVISKNLKRRHLDDDQRRMVAARLVNMGQGRPEKTSQDANISRNRAAEMLSVDVAGTDRARNVIAHGATALADAVDQGKVTVSTATVIAQVPKDEQQRLLEAAGGDEKKILAAAADIRARERVARFAEVTQRLAGISENSKPLPTGQKYPIIYADPATKYVSGFSNRSAENHYPTMTTEELCALPVGELALPDAVLFIWTTIPQLANTFDIARAWGFAKYCSAWCWDKVDQGPGHWAFNQHEELLIFSRGKFPAPVPGTQPRSVYAEKKTDHSAKPVWFAEQIERIWPALPKIELFCRAPRQGWARWGNQAEQDTTAEIASLHGCTASEAPAGGGAAELPAASPNNSRPIVPDGEDPLDIPAFLRRRAPDDPPPLPENVVRLAREAS